MKLNKTAFWRMKRVVVELVDRSDFKSTELNFFLFFMKASLIFC